MWMQYSYGTLLLKKYSSDLVLHFHEGGGLHKTNSKGMKTEAAEADISWPLVPRKVQGSCWTLQFVAFTNKIKFLLGMNEIHRWPTDAAVLTMQ